MGLLDAINKEDRIEVTFSTFYKLVKESAKCELVMNAVTCDVPHRYIREMATGKNDNPDSGLPESEQEERS
jgi:hypothetical protein